MNTKKPSRYGGHCLLHIYRRTKYSLTRKSIYVITKTNKIITTITTTAIIMGIRRWKKDNKLTVIESI